MGHQPYRHNAKVMERRSYDPEIPAVTVVTSVHRLTHDGFMYHISGKVTGFANAATDDFLIVAPPEKEGHIIDFNLTMGRGDIDIVTYEGTTTSNDGTPLQSEVFNTNRNSTNTPLQTLFSDPTITDVGTLIHTSWMPPTSTGTGQSASGFVGGGQGEEWTIVPAEKYLMRITNNSGSTIDYRYEFKWYEADYT